MEDTAGESGPVSMPASFSEAAQACVMTSQTLPCTPVVAHMLRHNPPLASCESTLTLHLRVAQCMLINVPSHAQLKATSAKNGEAASFDATLVLGRPGKAAPGILFLHGGPHSAYAASYVHSVAFLASLGYNVVIPNYRWAERLILTSSWG